MSGAKGLKSPRTAELTLESKRMKSCLSPIPSDDPLCAICIKLPASGKYRQNTVYFG
jgi:hypothetical protein